MRDPRDDISSHSVSFSKFLIFDLLMAIFSFFFEFFLLYSLLNMKAPVDGTKQLRDLKFGIYGLCLSLISLTHSSWECVADLLHRISSFDRGAGHLYLPTIRLQYKRLVNWDIYFLKKGIGHSYKIVKGGMVPVK